MVLVKDVDYHKVEEQFHEAVFTHASTSPNQQLIASLDVARRQMELEGFGLVTNAIEIALVIRREVNRHPLISKVLPHAWRRWDDPGRSTGRAASWISSPQAPTGRVRCAACREDEFCLDPTRMTLVCGTAGYDGTQFKNLLASDYNIQLNKTSRNSVLLQSNINNTRSDVAHLIRVLVEISRADRYAAGAGRRRRASRLSPPGSRA